MPRRVLNVRDSHRKPLLITGLAKSRVALGIDYISVWSGRACLCTGPITFLGRLSDRMSTVGWVATTLVFLGGVVCVVGYVLDQIPVLSRKLSKAIRSTREVRDAIRSVRGVQDAAEPDTNSPESTGKSHVGGPSR